VDRALNRAFFTECGLVFVVELHRHTHQRIAAPDPPQLARWG